MPAMMLKTITYGAMHFLVAVLVAFALTRNLAIALSIGLLEPLVQTFAYAVHEKVWTDKAKRSSSASGSEDRAHSFV